MVAWIGKSSSAKIILKPETAGTYEFFIVATNAAGNTSETVTVFIGDVPYLCKRSIFYFFQIFKKTFRSLFLALVFCHFTIY